MPRLVAIPPVLFGLTALTDGGAALAPVALLLGMAVLPWIVHAARPKSSPPDVLFASWVVVPTAILNLAGPSFGVDLSGESHNQFSLMILIWLVGEMAARASPRVVAGTVSATAAIVVGRVMVEPAFGHSYAFWIGGAGIALLTGLLLRRQQTTLAELREAQTALEGEAARRERQRVAREVHDVVAHTLTVTLLHVQAAARALDREPEAAREALREAEVLGRQSLADIRRTVGLLRAEGEGPDTHALPDASDLPALIGSFRAAGMRLDAEIDGDLAGLAPAPSLTLYRVTQEALANAAGHTDGAPVHLRVEVGESEVSITVSNPVGDAGPGRSGGLGILGMRERVGALGGTVTAGVQDDRWAVSATFPPRGADDPAEVGR